MNEASIYGIRVATKNLDVRGQVDVYKRQLPLWERGLKS